MIIQWDLIILAALWVVGTIQWIKYGVERFITPPEKKVHGWVWWILSFGLSFIYGGVLYLAPKSAVMTVIGHGLSVLSISQIGWDGILKKVTGMIEGLGNKPGSQT